jgi:hypothetical protein
MADALEVVKFKCLGMDDLLDGLREWALKKGARDRGPVPADADENGSGPRRAVL